MQTSHKRTPLRSTTQANISPNERAMALPIPVPHVVGAGVAKHSPARYVLLSSDVRSFNSNAPLERQTPRPRSRGLGRARERGRTMCAEGIRHKRQQYVRRRDLFPPADQYSRLRADRKHTSLGASRAPTRVVERKPHVGKITISRRAERHQASDDWSMCIQMEQTTAKVQKAQDQPA